MLIEKYEFWGVPLTASTAKKLILKHFKPFKRYRNKEIKDTIVSIHLKNGGKNHEGKDVWRNVFKKALSKLKDEGKVKNISYSIWEFTFKSENLEGIDIKQEVQIVKSEKIISKTKKIEPKYILGDKNLGGFIYLYYYPTYKKNGADTWPCKIGVSKDINYERIWNQVGTAMPEIPELELIIFHEKYKELEKFIHTYFKLIGKCIKEARGEEWFEINPTELFDFLIINKIVNYDDLNYLYKK